MATTKNPVHLFKELITTGTILAIIIYQRTISPLFPLKCRFEPSCSHYMIDVIKEWGLLKGGWFGIKRIGKCHPFGGWGYDPAPRKRKPDTTD